MSLATKPPPQIIVTVTRPRIPSIFFIPFPFARKNREGRSPPCSNSYGVSRKTCYNAFSLCLFLISYFLSLISYFLANLPSSSACKSFMVFSTSSLFRKILETAALMESFASKELGEVAMSATFLPFSINTV